MNKKIYWAIRQVILTVIFKTKKLCYKVVELQNKQNEYKSFRKKIATETCKKTLKATALIAITLKTDSFIIKLENTLVIGRKILITILLGGISVAGVILGLYCSNIASIYSSQYANAPKDIANAFQDDSLSCKCISGIVGYIVFGFIAILATLMGFPTNWALASVFVSWSIIVVVSYSIAGNRAYKLSDVYEVSEDAYQTLSHILSKQLKDKLFATDVNFQNYFMRIAWNQISLLKSVQKFGRSQSKCNNADNSAMVQFMARNLGTIGLYWQIKRCIGQSSLWYRELPRYPKWHLTDDTEATAALETGTSLQIKKEHNYNWFEEELFSINKYCIKDILEKRDYASLCLYIMYLENNTVSTALKNKETHNFSAHVDWISRELEQNLVSIDTNNNTRKDFACVIDRTSLLYSSLIIEANKKYQEFGIEETTSKVISAIDSGEAANKSEYVRNRNDVEFFEKIVTEVKIEGRRLTPTWVVKQQIAKEEYTYLNSLIDIIREGIDHTLSLGRTLSEKKLFFEACIVLTRFYEYESKLTMFLKNMTKCNAVLESFRIDKTIEWDAFRLEKLKDTIRNWKETIPTLLLPCSSSFALENWNNRDEYPDFLGEYYNHICEDAVGAITNSDKNQFAIDFENLSKIMLLYQEYVRTDFIKDKDLYRIEYKYYVITSPIVEWAQIGGLAVLWGELDSDNDWKTFVKNSSALVFEKNEKPDKSLVEKLIRYVQNRERFMFGIGVRSILETRWKQSVTKAIRNSNKLETEYTTFGRRLKTKSELLNAFCPNIVDMGFASDPSEVFWVLFANPYVSQDKKFHTQASWEKNFNG